LFFLWPGPRASSCAFFHMTTSERARCRAAGQYSLYGLYANARAWCMCATYFGEQNVSFSTRVCTTDGMRECARHSLTGRVSDARVTRSRCLCGSSFSRKPCRSPDTFAPDSGPFMDAFRTNARNDSSEGRRDCGSLRRQHISCRPPVVAFHLCLTQFAFDLSLPCMRQGSTNMYAVCAGVRPAGAEASESSEGKRSYDPSQGAVAVSALAKTSLAGKPTQSFLHAPGV
jgi:hypothetical protein